VAVACCGSHAVDSATVVTLETWIANTLLNHNVERTVIGAYATNSTNPFPPFPTNTTSITCPHLVHLTHSHAHSLCKIKPILAKARLQSGVVCCEGGAELADSVNATVVSCADATSG
jgi:hypothetical protein